MTFQLRAPRLEDAGGIASVANELAQELHGEDDETEATIRQWLTAPEFDPDDARAAVAPDGAIVGYADVDGRTQGRFWLDVRVPTRAGSAVLNGLIEWAEARSAERAGGNGAVLRGIAWSDEHWTKDAYEQRGYRLIRHSYRMRIDFDEATPEPHWPPGVTVRTAGEDDFRAAYEVHTETFADTWEPDDLTYDEWRHRMVGDPVFDPSLWFIAEAGGEPAAVALCKPHDTEPGLGWIGVLGVRSPWRRRGLGRALLLHVFAEFRRRGFGGMALGVDADSLTGANRLYETVGMHVFRRWDIYEKPL
jgi:mycothiol synthase